MAVERQPLTRLQDQQKSFQSKLSAFGQLKIAGTLDADVLQQAQLALSCQQWLNTVARSKHPDWEYADQESERIALMKAALESASAL